ncbi:MAG: sulfatase-like hydrolase/transferase [Opitutaceae bacterium]|nr:sulfatase-like hydrolase/transferase [Opitutaceae bacterium]
MAAGNPDRPNVIFILSDDQGAWALRSAGATELKTPNLDRLVAEGMSFTKSFVATPVCSPSRMTYFTGKLPSHHGLQFHLGGGSSAQRRWLDGHLTLTEVLAANGYSIGLSGKWHMGGDLTPQAGFSYWRVLHGVKYKDPEVVIDGRRQKVSGFKTDLETDYALEFIRQNKDRPFFLYWAANAPHRDYDFQPVEDRAPYRRSSFPSFPEMPIHPWQNPNEQLMGDHGNAESKTSYAALVTGLDRNIGRLLERLTDLGLLQKTLVIFASDNGYNTGHHGVWGKGSGTVPFNLYDESVRVPLVWWHPGRVLAGVRISQMVSNYDLFPSLLDYLGLSASADPKRVGRSYAPFLRGESSEWRDRVYFEYAYMRGVRTEDMKYIERTEDWPDEMYDLAHDPKEIRNLIDDPARRSQLTELKKDMEAFFHRIGAPPLENWGATTTQAIPYYSTARLPWYPLNRAPTKPASSP